MAEMQLEPGERVLLEVSRYFRSENEMFVLRVVEFPPKHPGQPVAKLEKRRFLKDGDVWRKSTPTTLVASDVRKIVGNAANIVAAMGEEL